VHHRLWLRKRLPPVHMSNLLFQCASAGYTCSAECREEDSSIREQTAALSVVSQEYTAASCIQDEWLSEANGADMPAPSVRPSFGPSPALPTKLDMPGPFASRRAANSTQSLRLSKVGTAASACSTSSPSSRVVSGNISDFDSDFSRMISEEQTVEQVGDVVATVGRGADSGADVAATVGEGAKVARATRPPRHAAAKARHEALRKAPPAKSLPRLLGAEGLDAGPPGLAGRMALIFQEFKGVDPDTLQVARVLTSFDRVAPLLQELGGLSGVVEELRAGVSEARGMVGAALTLGEALDNDAPRHQVEALAKEAVLASPSFAAGLIRAVRALAFFADFCLILRTDCVKDAGSKAFERQIRPQFGDGLWDQAQVVISRQKFTGCLPARDDEATFLARLEPSADARAKALSALVRILPLTEGVRRSLKARRLDDNKGRLPALDIEDTEPDAMSHI